MPFGVEVDQVARGGPLHVLGEGPLALTVTPRTPGYFDGVGDLLSATAFDLSAGFSSVDVEVTPAGEVLLVSGGAIV